MTLRAYPPPSGNNIKRGKPNLAVELQKAEVQRFRAAIAAMPENSRYRTAAKIRWLRDVMRADLKPTARVIAGVLLDYIGTRGMAWPGLSRLDADAKVSRSTVQRSLAELVEAGWLLENRATGRGNASAYTIDWNRFSEERASHATPFDEEDAEEEERVSSESEKGVKADAEKVSPVTPHTCNRIQERNPGAGASAREGADSHQRSSANLVDGFPQRGEKAATSQYGDPSNRNSTPRPTQTDRLAGFQGVQAAPVMPRGRPTGRPKGKLSVEDQTWKMKLEWFKNKGYWSGTTPAPGAPGCEAPKWLVEDVLGGPEAVARAKWRARLVDLAKCARSPALAPSLRDMRSELGEAATAELVREVFGSSWTVGEVEGFDRRAA